MNFAAVQKKLEARGYQVSCFASAQEAAAYLNAKARNESAAD